MRWKSSAESSSFEIFTVPVIGITSLVLGRLLDIVDEMVLLNHASAPKILLLEMKNISSWESFPWRESSVNSTIIIGSVDSYTAKYVRFLPLFIFVQSQKLSKREQHPKGCYTSNLRFLNIYGDNHLTIYY